MTASIYVCPLSHLDATRSASGARSVVTLLAREQRHTLPSFTGLSHIALDMSDITVPRDGYVLPDDAALAALLDFARRWDRSHPLLVHCYAGVSRSTAACFVIACALQPGADEWTMAQRLRGLSPSATPNPLVVALADAALGRAGRMIDAVRAIGRGRDCFEGEVFRFDLPA